MLFVLSQVHTATPHQGVKNPQPAQAWLEASLLYLSSDYCKHDQNHTPLKLSSMVPLDPPCEPPPDSTRLLLPNCYMKAAVTGGKSSEPCLIRAAAAITSQWSRSVVTPHIYTALPSSTSSYQAASRASTIEQLAKLHHKQSSVTAWKLRSSRTIYQYNVKEIRWAGGKRPTF